MNRVCRKAAILVLMMGAFCRAGAPATAPAMPELKAAFDKLAADDPADRDAAQDQLVQMGPAAIEPLKQLIASTADVEQRTGAQAAFARIVEIASVGPTAVTLKLDNVTPAKAIDELAKKSGYPIRLYNSDASDTRKVSLDVTGQNFWTVFQDVCRQGNFTLQNNGNNQLGVSVGGYMTGPVSVDGPFMIIARSINLSSHVQLQMRGNASKSVGVQFSCFVEPKLQISQRPYYVQLTECNDDKGRSLMVNNAGMFEGFADGGGQIMWDANTQLKIPEPDASKISVMRGTLSVVAATRTETIEIEDIATAKNTTKSAGGFALSVKNCTVSNDQVTVNLSLTFPLRRNGVQMLQQVKLLDTQGNPMSQSEANGPNGVGNNRLDYRVVYQRRDGDDKAPAKPGKLVLPVPVETKPLEFKFEFKDLPLPR